MDKKDLTKILNDHKKWVNGEGGERANLSDADLRNADLRNADLRNADLWNADLRNADLWNADLRNANLSDADLWNADLRNAVLHPPTILLLCNWGKVSGKLTSELMRYDAANHPKPHKFQEWADGGGCPYSSGFPRVAHFQENKELWKPGKAKSARELVLMLFKEKKIKYDPNL